jgi:hypothetical protein
MTMLLEGFTPFRKKDAGRYKRRRPGKACRSLGRWSAIQRQFKTEIGGCNEL